MGGVGNVVTGENLSMYEREDDGSTDTVSRVGRIGLGSGR